MLTNIEYAFQGLAKRKIFTLLAIFQLTISFILLYCSLYINDKLIESNNKVVQLFDNKIIYTLQNNEDYYEDLFKTDNEKKYIEYSKFLKNSDYFTHISYNSTYLLIKNFNGSEKFLNNSNYMVKKNNNNYVSALCLTIDKDYLKYFSLPTSEGKSFNVNDFNLDSENNIIPVLLGNKYKGIFSVGQVLEYVDKVDNDIKKIKIIAILKPGEYFTDASLPLNNITSLDNYIIFPQEQIKKLLSDDKKMMEKYNSNYRMKLYNYIMNSVIIIKNKKDETRLVRDVEEESAKLHFFDIKAVSAEKQMKKYIDMYKQQNYIINALFFIVFGTCSAGIISNMLYIIKRRYKEFGIHLLNGASIYDIMKRLFYEVAFLMIISSLFCFLNIILLSKTGFIQLEFSSSLKLFGIIIILTFIVAAFPVRYFLKNQANDILRRDE